MLARIESVYGCIAALALVAGCSHADTGGDDDAGAQPIAPRVVAGPLDRVPLCIWGSPGGAVWIGGGGLAAGVPSLLLRGDGRTFDEVPLEGGTSTETVWWLHGTADDDAWAVGERGAIWHWNGSAWTRTPSGTAATLFGVWAAAKDDVWSVGGSPDGSGPNDVLLHWDGNAWSAVEPPKRWGVAYFKVWGSGPSDVHVVGQGGVALHRDQARWTTVDTGAKATLFTVHGANGVVRAVGGAPAVMMSRDGDTWTRRGLPKEAAGVVSGVFVRQDGTVVLGGDRHQLYRLSPDGSYVNDGAALAIQADLHAVWSDATGNVLAVGGNYVALAQAGVKPVGYVVRVGD